MSITLIIILVVIVGALLVVKAKQGKANNTTAASSNKKTPKGAKKASTVSKTAPPQPEAPPKPKVDLESLCGKLDVLIADKEYAKAEGLINLSLNQDRDLHDLYFKLLTIYQLQHDDFAIKQLLDTVQNLNLNTLYQQLYNEQEIYKEELERTKKAEQAQKSPEFIEFSSTAVTTPNEQSVEAKVQNNSQAFDGLAFDLTPTTNTETQTTTSPADNTLDFNFSTTTPEEKSVVEEPVLEFKLDTTPTVEETPTSEFTFSLENNTVAEPAVEFNFAEPEQVTEAAPIVERVSIIEEVAPIVEQPVVTEFADAADPIVQAFPDLTALNPIDLDIDLAEQYIRLGDFAAAKELLTTSQDTLSDEQATKVEQLLQKIAS